jgi:hypothetical protein
MQTLRRAHLLARFVLVWFVLSIGAAIASPVINPQPMQLICTGSGVMKVLITTPSGMQEDSSRSMDCPLCVTMSAPPSVFELTFESVSPLSYAVQPIPAAVIAKLTAAPLPARGPPNFI